jgi:hypothetical protein
VITMDALEARVVSSASYGVSTDDRRQDADPRMRDCIRWGFILLKKKA